MPWDMIDSARQVLEVIDKKLLGTISFSRQWLHHGEHLSHVWLGLLKDTLHSSIIGFTARFIDITRSRQVCELEKILSSGFMVYITCHPVKGPSLDILVVPRDVEGGIKLQQQLLVPVLFVCHKRK
jgi:hypothetical protein